ncbi:MAG: cyclic nucleotide-binding domain-containing protein [Anaerolinea sp.]|nr:cyclic nucleotide-binding domain-containing protein [Anaerolinea sp.]
MSLVTTLKQADIFYDLTPTQLELVASICSEKMYNVGDIIFEENTTGGEIYVIANGEVEIQINPAMIGKESTGGSYTIAVLRRGQSFGEISLVDEGLRSARARSATANTHLILIPREQLMYLCSTYPQMGFRLMRNLAADLAMKIRNTDLQVREYLVWMQRQ